ncbi:1-deoxy-D-xylulose-5-phosphate reductoisomerase [Mucilaginibacter pocheonensis]|uniref:1-deoxy-D-xylulose 5-phosphate reductoisomerase n=1 Tax=Mucilaginibacter pocheonensis TaxID=398050 RepID=A0ABU1TEG5_9SPHI|nr:1-deoxy-D-xylulose-5-phosphate reductoisomerase [Mucilaginibacter pocheonensis]MDR6943724.1 1-deoxy-D-xylulose-5-phosphate reductoisomerase [Mucilaginibacter pocheonensis]
MKKKNIAILGSTGSVGTQALEVISAQPDHFNVIALTAENNADLLIAQAIKFLPKSVVIGNESLFRQVSVALKPYSIDVMCGSNALSEIVQLPEIDLVLAAVMGFAGLKPVVAAIKAGKHIAIANKEPLVVAGELIMAEVIKHKVSILPVDSEHSAIFQCLAGERYEDIEKIYITASGGPFFGRDKASLQHVTPAHALKHPNWSMGNKITIDSASLMNKGLEAIEAKWLFNLQPKQIDIIVHPQSIVHSLVQFSDGSLKAQLGLPDMKLPIHYAFHFPERQSTDFKRFNFLDYPELNFHKPDLSVFQNLSLAYEALYQGGIMPCVLNAANEVAVAAFLSEKIAFLEMSDVISEAMTNANQIENPSLEDYFEIDNWSRDHARSYITNRTKHAGYHPIS